MEDGKDFKIGMAVIALALTVAICLGGFHIYKEYGIKKPLTESILKVDGVQKVVIQDEKNVRIILVTLKDDTGDLKGVFQTVNEIAEEKLGDKLYEIRIADDPSPELTSLYDDLELGIHQGIANSSFIWLTEWIDKKTASEGTVYQIQVDNKNLYFKISKGDHYLTRIIERGNESQSNGRGETDA